MPTYILRDLPDDAWARFKARAQRDGWPLRALFVALMQDYASDRLTPTAPPPPRASPGDGSEPT